MRKIVVTLLMIAATGCTTSRQDPRYLQETGANRLPERISAYAIRAGMAVSQVQEILKLKTPIDVSRPLTDVAGPFDNNPWSGFYWIEFKSNAVSRVSFYRGNMSVVTGVWILSESRDER